jgi:hypothetical protein
VVKQEVNAEHYTREALRAVKESAPRQAIRLGSVAVDCDALLLGCMSKYEAISPNSSVTRYLQREFRIGMNDVNSAAMRIPVTDPKKLVAISGIWFTLDAARALKAAELHARNRSGSPDYKVRRSDIAVGLVNCEGVSFLQLLRLLKINPTDLLAAMAGNILAR